MTKMLTDPQLKTVEALARYVLQKIADVKREDARLRTMVENPSQFSPNYRHGVEKAARHADRDMSTAIDDLRDVLNGLTISVPPVQVTPLSPRAPTEVS